MLTDGYIQDNSNDDWLYVNVRERGGPNPSATGDAWIRVERSGGAIPGTKVTSNGIVSEGPTVAFMTPSELLDSVPADAFPSVSNRAQAAGKLFIKWAGIHPGSLREVLIVWSQPIVLLNRDKIRLTGGRGGSIEAVGVEGRLMTIALAQPVGISGDQVASLSFEPGCVGCFVKFTGNCGPVEEPEQTVGNGGGGLPTLPEPEGCGCEDPVTGAAAAGGGGSTGGAVLDGLIFNESTCNRPPPAVDTQSGFGGFGAALSNALNVLGAVSSSTLNQISGSVSFTQQRFSEIAGNLSTQLSNLLGSAQEGFAQLAGSIFGSGTQPDPNAPTPDSNTSPSPEGLGFVINNGFAGVVVRCTYPFMLHPVQFKCNDTCVFAPVWLVCYKLFGTTQPVRTVPLSSLMDTRFDVCDWERNDVYGMLLQDAECAQQISAQIIGASGEAVTLSGIWRGELPGYAGQTVEVHYQADSACDEQCVNVFNPHDTECWVSEDILKPKRRTLPLEPYKTVAVTERGFKLETVTIPISTSSELIHVIKDISLTNITVINNIPEGAEWLQDVFSTSINNPSNIQTVHNVMTGNIPTVVTGCAGTTIQVCNESGELVSIFVVTECLTASVTLQSAIYFETEPVSVITDLLTSLVLTEILENVPYDVVEEERNVALFEDREVEVPIADEEDPTFQMLGLDPAGDIKLIRLTTTDTEDPDGKFLKAPDKDTGLATLRLPLPGCGPKYMCLQEGIESPEEDEGDSQTIILLSPIWTRTPMNGEGCPCYANCESEPCDAPQATEEFNFPNGGPIAPCTVSVKRLQRNWCKACNIA